MDESKITVVAGWTIVVPHREVTRLDGLIHAVPHPALAGHVLTYTAMDVAHPAPVSWHIAPLGAVTVGIDLHTPDRDCPPHPVTGLRDRPLAIREGPGRSCSITVALSPAGAVALFGLPLKELANASIALADLLGRHARELVEQVAEAGSWPQRFRAVDRMLLARRGTSTLPPQVTGAWQRITSTAGGVRVEDVAEEVGWTRQHLRTRFREHIGLTPKTVARLSRLARAAALMATPDALPWAEIAARCGYADQSHLNRDFRDLAGLRPSDYAPADSGKGSSPCRRLRRADRTNAADHRLAHGGCRG